MGPLPEPVIRRRFARGAVVVALAALAAAAQAGAPRPAISATPTPPGAAIARPGTLTGPLVVVFDEAVTGVSRATIVLRESGKSENLPGKIVCHDEEGAAARCDLPVVVRVLLTPARALVPGQWYTATVNPAGAEPIRDLEGTPAPRTSEQFRASLVEQEDSAAARYRWRMVGATSAHGGSYAVERLAGARARFRFSGRSLVWYTIASERGGLAEVFIDGSLRGVFNQYAPATRFRVPRIFSGLTSGTHVVEIRVTGRRGTSASRGTEVAVDAFKVGTTLFATPSVAYGWRIGTSTAASGGFYALTDAAGADVAFTFRGTGVDWFTMLGPNQGRAEVSVDGRVVSVVDNYAASVRHGVRRTVRLLSDGVHTLRIRVLGAKQVSSSGRFIAVDRFAVHPSTIAFRKLGAWIDLWDYGLDPRRATADMSSRGVRTVYLQTARYNSTADIVNPTAVSAWIEAARAAGIRIVGWYLPGYADLDRDVRRTAAIARFRTASGRRFDGLAIDIEYRAEVGYDRTRFNGGVASHLRRVRAAVGVGYPVGAIVPSPVAMTVIAPRSWAGFPWDAVGRYSDVVLPMAYWSYRTGCPTNPTHCAHGYTVANIAEAKRLSGLPVHSIGGVADSVTAGEVADFVRGALAERAYGASLYDYKTTRAEFWPALASLNGL